MEQFPIPKGEWVEGGKHRVIAQTPLAVLLRPAIGEQFWAPRSCIRTRRFFSRGDTIDVSFAQWFFLRQGTKNDVRTKLEDRNWTPPKLPRPRSL